MSIVFGTPTSGSSLLGEQPRRHAERVLAADGDERVQPAVAEVLQHPLDAAFELERVRAARADDRAAARQDPRHLLRAEILEDGSTRPRQPSRTATTSQPAASAARTTARITALSPGQSPPPVRLPRLFAIASEPADAPIAPTYHVPVTVQPHAASLGLTSWAASASGCGRSSAPASAFGLISFIGLLLIPPVVVGYPAGALGGGTKARSMLGLVAGAGLPLLLVAGLQWNSWHHRIVGDNTPNPYDWGGSASAWSSPEWPRSPSRNAAATSRCALS